MTLQELKYVIAIAGCSSMTEAARELYISQPSLSNAVKELEKELGIEIFNRYSKGVSLSSEGAEFLTYARQIMEQVELMEQRYLNKKPSRKLFSVSTQHYAFAVNAFSNIIKELDTEEYELTLRETRTYEIINDVRDFKSEVGILYINDFNRRVLLKLIEESHLELHTLFTARPHVFVSSSHPLAGRPATTTEELEEFPFLCFEQGEYNSFYFSEEILSTLPRKKVIQVSDRATLFNLLIGLNGYTICTGILNSDLNGDDIVSVPLVTGETMTVAYLLNPRFQVSSFTLRYLDELKRIISDYGYDIREKRL